MADARMTALRGLSEVFGQGGYSNLVLENLMRKQELSGQERAFCTALFYGVVERRITLDWVLGRYSRQPVEKLSPAVRDILRMAVYQLFADIVGNIGNVEFSVLRRYLRMKYDLKKHVAQFLAHELRVLVVYRLDDLICLLYKA